MKTLLVLLLSMVSFGALANNETNTEEINAARQIMSVDFEPSNLATHNAPMSLDDCWFIEGVIICLYEEEEPIIWEVEVGCFETEQEALDFVLFLMDLLCNTEEEDD